MTRFFVLALVGSLATSSAAFAGDTLVTTGTRHVQQLAAAEIHATAPPNRAQATAPKASYQAEGGPSNLSKSGHSTMTKAMIYTALGVGFGLAAWQIDKHVLNITPSTLGQRKD